MHDLMLRDGDDQAPRLVLAHGAGAPMDSDWMHDLTRGLVQRGLGVVRFEFPYMRGRREGGTRRGPDRPDVLLATWRQVVAELGGGEELVIGGKSMGGRVASMVADEVSARGLVCLGYPFHPPRRPQVLRTAHLATLRTPTLILQGERDPFGLPEEVARYDLADSVRVHWLVDGDHSFKPRVKSGRTLVGNMDEAVDAAAAFVKSLA